jgi:hypothetical protein
MGPIKKAIAEGHKVEAIKSLKANGENCQISFVSSINAWSISSKNVCLFARDPEDIKFYQGKNAIRYSFASMMAECWF